MKQCSFLLDKASSPRVLSALALIAFGFLASFAFAQTPQELFQFFDSGFGVRLLETQRSEKQIHYDLRISGLAAFPLQFKSYRNPARLHVEIDRFLAPRTHQATSFPSTDIQGVHVYPKGNATHIEVLFASEEKDLRVQGARDGSDAVVSVIRVMGEGDMHRATFTQDSAGDETEGSQDTDKENIQADALVKKEEILEEENIEDGEELAIHHEEPAFFDEAGKQTNLSPDFSNIAPESRMPEGRAQRADESRETERRGDRDESKPRPILATQHEEYFLKRLNTTKVFVENQYGKSLFLEARVGRLVFPGTEHEHMEMDSEVQVKPKSQSLNKKKKLAFQLLYLGSPGSQEKAYQLELKAFSKDKKKSLGVLRVPLFSIPERPNPDIQWEREKDTLGLKNLGNVSVLLREGRVCMDVSSCQALGPIRIYPGNKIGIQVPQSAWAEFLVAYQQGTTKLSVPVYVPK